MPPLVWMPHENNNRQLRIYYNVVAKYIYIADAWLVDTHNHCVNIMSIQEKIMFQSYMASIDPLYRTFSSLYVCVMQ